MSQPVNGNKHERGRARKYLKGEWGGGGGEEENEKPFNVERDGKYVTAISDFILFTILAVCRMFVT